eukprot:gene6279-17688_t
MVATVVREVVGMGMVVPPSQEEEASHASRSAVAAHSARHAAAHVWGGADPPTPPPPPPPPLPRAVTAPVTVVQRNNSCSNGSCADTLLGDAPGSGGGGMPMKPERAAARSGRQAANGCAPWSSPSGTGGVVSPQITPAWCECGVSSPQPTPQQQLLAADAREAEARRPGDMVQGTPAAEAAAGAVPEQWPPWRPELPDGPCRWCVKEEELRVRGRRSRIDERISL